MQWQLLFLSIIPLVPYMALSTGVGQRRAIVAAIVVSGLELGYNSFQLGLLEPFSLLSFTLFALLGAMSISRDDPRFFKLQPVAFELGAAAALVYYQVVLDTPLLAVIAKDHLRLHDVLAAYQRGYATVYATTLSRSLPYVLVLHAALTARAAWTWSTWSWFNVRVFGFYAMVAILFLGERLLGVTP